MEYIVYKGVLHLVSNDFFHSYLEDIQEVEEKYINKLNH